MKYAERSARLIQAVQDSLEKDPGWVERKINGRTKENEKGCHLWTGAKNNLGYPQVSLPNYGPTMYVHRLVYLVTHGEIPYGAYVDHTCSNRDCVRPEHLSCTPKEKA
jgi:hypothetical protein